MSAPPRLTRHPKSILESPFKPSMYTAFLSMMFQPQPDSRVEDFSAASNGTVSAIKVSAFTVPVITKCNPTCFHNKWISVKRKKESK